MRPWFQALRHRLAHVFSLNACEQVDWHDATGFHIGARCVTCGAIHPDTVWTPRH